MSATRQLRSLLHYPVRRAHLAACSPPAQRVGPNAVAMRSKRAFPALSSSPHVPHLGPLARRPSCATCSAMQFTTALARAAMMTRSASSATSTSASMQSRRLELERLQGEAYKKRNQTLFMYTAAVLLLGLGVTYAAVPFYRAFCAATGFSGTPVTAQGRFEPSRLVAVTDEEYRSTTGLAPKRIRITFNSDTSDALPWSFTPATKEIHVLPGETALAFYQAKNRGPNDIVGIATYNVAPDRIAPYFAKVECFCFEEQKLLAGEEVDLPVFFFIDRDMLEDPSVKDIEEVVLSYTFFSARRNETNGQLEPDTDLSKYSVGIGLPGVK